MSFGDEQDAATISASRAVSPNIYRRQVPGISNGQLASAISADQQRQRDEPTINAAFSQTSPSVYYHQQAHAASLSSGHQQQQQQQQQPFATWGQQKRTSSPQLDQVPVLASAVPLTAAQADALLVNQSLTNASLAQLADEHKKLQRANERADVLATAGETIEQQVAALQSSVSTLTWLLVALGLVLLTLLVVLVVLVSRAYSIACTNQQQAAQTKQSNLVASDSSLQAGVPLSTTTDDSLFN